MAGHSELVREVQTVRKSWPFIDYPARLDEWRRWCMDFAGIGPEWPGCASIESLYLHPQRNHWHPPDPRPPEIIERRAEQVEAAVRSLSNAPLLGHRSASERKVFRVDVLFYPKSMERPEQFLERKRRYCQLPEAMYLEVCHEAHYKVRQIVI